MAHGITPTGVERFFSKDDIIVSKTDLKGRITYANKTFLQIAGFTEQEVLGQLHSILRYPDMPRCIFKVLWDTIQAKEELFAYVVNMTKNGDHYWVLAHVTPTMDEQGNISNYHSNRRVPDPNVIRGTIAPLYRALLEEERKYPNSKEGLEKSYAMLMKTLEHKGVAYDAFVFSLANGGTYP